MPAGCYNVAALSRFLLYGRNRNHVADNAGTVVPGDFAAAARVYQPIPDARDHHPANASGRRQRAEQSRAPTDLRAALSRETDSSHAERRRTELSVMCDLDVRDLRQQSSDRQNSLRPEFA